MAVSHETIKINLFLTPCQPRCLFCTPFIFNILHLMRAFPLAHVNTRATSLMLVKNTSRHLQLLSGTLEQRKCKEVENTKLNDYSEYYNQFSMYIV